MKKILKNIILFGIIGIFVFSCEKNKIEPDPTKAILGKWEMIEIGNWPNMESYSASGYDEYLPDSLLGIYNYTTKEYQYAKEKYWIDSLLHYRIIRQDGFIITQNYKYTFFDEKIRLDLLDVFAIYNTFIYKRIK